MGSLDLNSEPLRSPLDEYTVMRQRAEPALERM